MIMKDILCIALRMDWNLLNGRRLIEYAGFVFLRDCNRLDDYGMAAA
jgi:hypothetical protein